MTTARKSKEESGNQRRSTPTISTQEKEQRKKGGGPEVSGRETNGDEKEEEEKATSLSPGDRASLNDHRRPSQEGATDDDDDDVDDISERTTTTSGGRGEAAGIDGGDSSSLSVDLQSMLVVGISGGSVAVVLVLLVVVLCRCSRERVVRPGKNPSPLSSSSNKTERGKSYPYEACNTLPPPPNNSVAADSISLTADGYLSKNNSGTLRSHLAQAPPFPSPLPSHSPHPRSAHLTHHHQLSVALVANACGATMEPAVVKASTKRDVKEWYV